MLVVGGRVGRGTVTARTEIFDPVAATFGRGPDLPAAPDGAVAAELPDGRAAQPVGRLRQARFKHAIVPWVDGSLLVVGGTSDDRELLDSTEVFDPRTSSFTPGPRLAHGRYKLSGGVAELPDGRVVVGGGGPGAELLEPGAKVSAVVDAVGIGVASFSTVSVVGSDLWFVGGYDRRVNLTGQDRRVPIAAV